MGKSEKKKKLSFASKDGVGDKPDDRTSISVKDKETNDTDNDLSKKSPAVSGPTTRSKSDHATKQTESDPKSIVDLPNLNLPDDSDTSSVQHRVRSMNRIRMILATRPIRSIT